MLAGSTTASSTISTHTSPVLSDTPSPAGRRRGLSYLRSHLHHAPTAPPTADSPLPRPPTLARTRTDPASPTTEISRDPLRQLEALRLPISVRSSTEGNKSIRGDNMTRSRATTSPTAPRFPGAQAAPGWLGLDFGLPLQASENAPAALPAADGLHGAPSNLPSIQFIPASEPHRSRPSLDFRRITRVLPNTSSIIRVGRYSERDSAADANPHTPSDAPIGFKSKVVSRRHCEFSYSENQWFIKDVKSSSGTFLNHIRLSQPGLESKPFPVNDGDIVQLGIDFKGGEEMIFRCVKIRVETNRGWQRGLNKFKQVLKCQISSNSEVVLILVTANPRTSSCNSSRKVQRKMVTPRPSTAQNARYA